MKGDFKMNLGENVRMIRELFNVDESRCKELCDLVDTIQESNPDWPINRVLEVASEHTMSEDENRFLIAQYFHDNGVNQGIEMGLHTGFKASHIVSLFERALHHQEGGIRVRKDQMN